MDDKFPEWQTWDQFVSTEAARALTTDAMLSSHPIEIPIHDPKLINQVSTPVKIRLRIPGHAD